MIEIEDADLADDGTLFGWTLLLMQAQLDVAVFSGSGTVLVTAGEELAGIAGFPGSSSSLDPIEVPGLFTGVVNDLYLSRIFAAWTTERGGALRLGAAFEEEGVELRGGLADVDFDHMQLDVFLLPSLDATDTVVWETQLAFQVDGGVLTDVLRGRIEDELLTGEIVTQILEAIDPVKEQLNLLFGLQGRAVRSIVIEDGKATFDDVPATTPRYSIVFDAVEIHDDSDGSGQGELTFSATVGEIEVGSTVPVSSASGTVVPLEGSAWRVSPALQNGSSVSVRFEAFDDDGDNRESLGFVNVDLDPDDAPQVLELPSSRGNFTLLARLEPRGGVTAPDGSRYLRVSVPTVRVLRDQDGAGAGEVQFWALAAGQPTRVSEEAKAKGSDNPEIAPGLSVDVHLPPGDDLELRVIGWDVDPSQRDWMGEATTVVERGALGDAEPLVLTSDTGDFEATIEIVDLDAPPDDPGPGTEPEPEIPEGVETVRRLVVLESLTVRRDGDIGPGELRITAAIGRTAGPDDDFTLNDIVVTNPVPIETSSRALLPLVADDWRVELDVPADGRLIVSAAVVDVDEILDDPSTPQDEGRVLEEPLGEGTLRFDAGEDHGLGEHLLASDDGDVELRLRILDPAERDGDVRTMLRFEEVEILRDRTAVGRASLWCRATINGFPVGNELEFKAGNGDTIVLQESIWTVPAEVDRGEDLEVTFEVFEADDPDHVSLGTVTTRAPLPWPDGRLATASDTGDFVLRYRSWDPTAAGADRLSVTFLEVTVLDDGEPTSEGELRFLGAANELWTELSVLQKARTGETVPLVGLPWTLEPAVDARDELTVAFTVFAEDRDALARLDRVEQSFSVRDAWGLGEHVVTSPDEKFRVRFAIAPASENALPDAPGMVPLLVEFTSVQVNDDGDGGTKGEVSFTGKANGPTLLQTEPVKVDAGESVELGVPLAPRTVWLEPDQDLDIVLLAFEHDGRQADLLGTSRHVHAAADGWELGSREVRSPGGAIVATWRVDRADGPKARVKFLHVHVLDDDEPVKQGDFVCEGAVNDVTTGVSLKMKAGSDGASSADDVKSDIFIGGPRWTKTVSYDPDDPQLDVRFTLTELDGGSSEHLLGTVTVDASDALSERRLYTQLADSGKYRLTFVAEALT